MADYEPTLPEDKEALLSLARYKARSNFLSFVDWCWRRTEPLIIGRHTRAIADRLSLAVEDFLHGKSTYLIIQVPFRHGKSDLVSRYFPAYFLGRTWSEYLAPDIVVASYSGLLAQTFSRFCMSVVESEQFNALYPGAHIAKGRGSVQEWGLDGSVGNAVFVGLDGSVTGKGGNLIVVDDYCKNREDAYSKTMREKTWGQFSTDIMSRRHDPCIVCVCATPWHPDDLVGRIRESMGTDPDFPQFEDMVFPARKAGENGWDTLFPERFSDDWYRSQRATLGPEMSAALLDCNPVGEGTRLFKNDWIHYSATAPNRRDMNVYLLVDSANSKRSDRNADYTSMQVWGLAPDKNYYLIDAIRDRMNLQERTAQLFKFVQQYHPNNTYWEQVGAMSDVQHVQLEQERHRYHFPIIPISQHVKKEDRIGWLVPLFEQGRIWFPPQLLKTRTDGTNYDFVHELINDEFSQFPAVKHDDVLDCMANLMHPTVVAGARFPDSVNGIDTESTGTVRTTAHSWRPRNW